MLAILRQIIPLFIIGPLVRSSHKRIFPVVTLVSQA
jgi:hypothetical protein